MRCVTPFAGRVSQDDTTDGGDHRVVQLLNRVDVGLLHPGLVRRVVEMLAACKALGFDYWAISGFRGAGEQQALYEQGRTRVGPHRHQRALARGGTQLRPGHRLCARPHDDARGDGWLEPRGVRGAGPAGAGARPDVGGDFRLKDPPHVQLPGFVTAAGLDPLRRVYTGVVARSGDPRARERARLMAVWMHLDAATRPTSGRGARSPRGASLDRAVKKGVSLRDGRSSSPTEVSSLGFASARLSF